MGSARRRTARGLFLAVALGAATAGAGFAADRNSCPKGGDLLFVVETVSGRLSLRADAPDSVLIRKGGAWMQMDWTCGALRIPAKVTYVPRRPRPGAPKIDGTVLTFDLDSAR
jgi:hypothetical protein